MDMKLPLRLKEYRDWGVARILDGADIPLSNDVFRLTDATLIVRAVNNYAALVSACEALVAYEDSMDGNEDGNDEAYWKAVRLARAALAALDGAAKEETE